MHVGKTSKTKETMMMRSSRIRIVFAACAVLASGAFAQTAVDGTCVPVATADSATQLAALATAYGVTVDELTSYADQGYAIGEIRFAIQISQATGSSLAEVVALAGAPGSANWKTLAVDMGVTLKAGPIQPGVGGDRLRAKADVAAGTGAGGSSNGTAQRLRDGSEAGSQSGGSMAGAGKGNRPAAATASSNGTGTMLRKGRQ
jgi:hypothetical protein